MNWTLALASLGIGPVWMVLRRAHGFPAWPWGGGPVPADGAEPVRAERR